ncbi:MAG: amidohydrolase family protein [Acidobacteria bacterium]|nr:amidohydrolase family protein [Acidobacteriota bacterium]
MKIIRFLLILACSCNGASAALAQTTAIVGGSVIDGTGAPPQPNAIILIDGKKIVAIGKQGAINVPAGAKVIDASGKYIIPGLIDTNIHLFLTPAIDQAWLGKYEGRFEEIAAEAAQLALKSGLTTVFDSWGPLQPLLNARDGIRRGELVGSRLYVAGNIVGLSGPLGRDFQSGIQQATVSPAFAKRINKIWEENVGPDLLDKTPEEVRTEIRKYIGRGVDFIKFAESSHNLQAAKNNWLMFSPDAAKAIVEEGHKAGITVQTHTSNIESLRLAVLAGIDMAQHPAILGEREMPDSLVRLLVDRGVYCGVLSKTKKRIEIEKEGWRDTGGKGTSRSPEALDHWQGNIVKLIRAGARITLATDQGPDDPKFSYSVSPRLREDEPTRMGEGQFLWLESIVEKGMSPMDAIVAATRNGAAAYHHLSEFGTLEGGKYADLLVLDANPLENISNARKISLVMKEGAVIDRDRLPEKKILTQ